VCSNFPTNQSIHLLHWSLKRRPKSSRTRGCDSGRSSTSTISPSGLRSRSWQLTTGSRYVEARYTTVNICVVTSIGREPVKGLREDVVEDDRFWEGAVVGVIYYCFDYLSQNHHRFRRLALNEDMEYEVGSAESVSTAVVRAVSAVDGRNPVRSHRYRMFSIRTRLMHSLTHTLTVNRELVADSRSSIAAAVSPSTTASFSPFSPSTTTHGLPAIESPAVLTVDEVSYCCDSLRMTTEGHGRESVLGP